MKITIEIPDVCLKRIKDCSNISKLLYDATLFIDPNNEIIEKIDDIRHPLFLLQKAIRKALENDI